MKKYTHFITFTKLFYTIQIKCFVFLIIPLFCRCLEFTVTKGGSKGGGWGGGGAVARPSLNFSSYNYIIYKLSPSKTPDSSLGIQSHFMGSPKWNVWIRHWSLSQCFPPKCPFKLGNRLKTYGGQVWGIGRVRQFIESSLSKPPLQPVFCEQVH